MTELLGMIVMVLGVTALALVIVGATAGRAVAFNWLYGAGEVLYNQIGWTLGLYIAVLVGFYAISIGGQVIGDSAAVARVRTRLGTVAELMAAVTVPVMVLVAIYCWRNPASWAVFFVLLPIAGIVFFLAIELGALVFIDKKTRVAAAARTRTWGQLRLKRLARRSRRSMWLVLPLNAAAIALLPVLIALPVLSIDSALLLWPLHFVTALVLLGGNAWSLYMFKLGPDLTTRVLVWVLPGLLYFVAITVGLVIIWNGAAPPAVGWGLFVTAGATLVTTFWPRRWATRFVLDWSLQGAITTRAARTVIKKYAKATREYLALTALPPGPPSLLQRLRRKTR